MIWRREPTLMKRADAAVSREPEGCKVLGKRLSLCNGFPFFYVRWEGTIKRNLDRTRSAGPLAHTVTMLTSSYYCHFWEIGEGILLEERLGYLHSTFFLRRKGRDPPASSLSRATGRCTTTVSCSRPDASLRLSPRRITATKTCHMPINSF
ncbi:hypothetical protein DY000_02038572 [Brassica cretica]|uniref:Uncharacterized protein n=1 Tax=Brassica cretica TaxID=69181 RepID=A0ABQ7BHC0_BRACR|nr:hypothetical protein DY000_02038572 [Brassica cretica]